MRSRAKPAMIPSPYPETLQRAIAGLILLMTFVALQAQAEPPVTRLTSAAISTELRAKAPAGSWRLTELRTQTYPARFTQIPDLSSRDYLRNLSLPMMGGDGRGIRDQSPTEQLARQVHREGLPLARLWQNDQALVSLGLNRKGKPGLWIIQKTH